MTTANLSVGIDTTQAKLDLANLRKEMAGSAHKLLVSVDPTSIDQDIQRYLKQRTFKIKVNTRDLGAEIANDVGKAFDSAFSRSGENRKLKWNQAALRGGLDSAVNQVFNDKERRLRLDRTTLFNDLSATVGGALSQTHRVGVDRTALAEDVRVSVAAGLSGATIRNVKSTVGPTTVPAPRTETKAAVTPDIEAPVFAINTGAMTTELSAALTKVFAHAHEVQVKTTLLRGEIETALRLAFVDPHRVNIDGTAITTEVKRAIDLAFGTPGLAGGVVRLAGVAGSATAAKPPQSLPGDTAAVVKTIRDVLLPAVDELQKAALQIASVARKAGLGGAGGGVLKAKEGMSVKDPVTGVSTSFTRTLGDEPLVEARIKTSYSSKVHEKAQQDQDKRIFATNNALSNQRVTEVGRAEASGFKALAKAEAQIAATRSALVGQRVAEIGKAEASGFKALAKAEAEIAATRSALVSQRVAEIGKAEASGFKALAKAEAQIAATRSALVGQRVAEIGKAEVAQAKISAENEGRVLATRGALVNQRVTQIGKNEAETLSAEKKGAAAIAGTRASLVDQRIKAIGDSEKDSIQSFMSRTRAQQIKTFKPLGADISTARIASEKFGEAPTRAVLGPKREFLLDTNHDLTEHARIVSAIKPAVDATRGSHKLMTAGMQDMHAAARGLAGSMGALWATYGNLAPLLAFAAIGAAMRSIYEDGKKVEFQLAFIKGLGGEAITAAQVENATAGSMQSPTQALEGLRALAQSGLSTKEALSSLPDVLSLATVGEISVGEAAFAATGVLKAFGLEIGDIGRVSDVMAKSAAVSNASVQDMMAGFKYASASASMYGATLEETGAALAMLAEKNIKGSMGGTAHMNLLKEIYTPTKKAGDAFKSLGLDMQAMQREGMTSVEMIDKIRQATAKLDSTGVTAFAAAIGGERGMREMAPLLTGGTKKLVEMQQELMKSKGFTQSVMIELQNTVEGSSARMKQALVFALSGAFDENKGAIQTFNNEVASALGSPVFKSYVDSIANGMVAATRFLIDHAEAIKNVGLGYLTLKGVGLLTTVMSEIAGSMARVAVAGQAKLAVMRSGVVASELSAVASRSQTVAEQAHNAALSQAITLEIAKRTAVTGSTVATVQSSVVTTAAAMSQTAATGLLGTATAFASRTAFGLAAGASALSRIMAFLAGPVGLVIGLVMTLGPLWAMLTSKQDEAKEAQDRYTNSINNTNRILDQEIERLRLKRYLLDHPGKSEAQATILQRVQAQGDYIKAVENAYNFDTSKDGGHRGQKFKITGIDGKEETYTSGKQIKELYESLNKRVGDKNLSPKEALADLVKTTRKIDADTGQIEQRNGQDSLVKFLEQSIDQLEARKEGQKDTRKLREIDDAIGVLKYRKTPEYLSGVKDSRQAQSIQFNLKSTANAGGEKWTVPGNGSVKTPKADSIGHANALAEVEDIKHAYDRNVKETEARYKTEDLMLNARHRARLVSDDEFEIRLNAIAKRHSAERIDIANREQVEIKQVTDRIKAEDAKLPEKSRKLKNSDLKKIERDLADAQTKAELAANDEMNRAKTAAFEMEGAIKKASESARDFQMTQAVRDMKALRDMAVGLENFQIGSDKGIGPSASQTLFGKDYVAGVRTAGLTNAAKEAVFVDKEEARRSAFERSQQKKFSDSLKLGGNGAKDMSVKAALAAYDEYAARILELTKHVESTQVYLDDLNSRRDGFQASLNNDHLPGATKAAQAEIEILDQGAAKAAEKVKQARAELDALEAMRGISAATRGDAAKKVYDEERTAAAGAIGFWRRYSQEATDSAKVIDNAMSQTFSSMEQGLMKFVTTGKLNFGDFTRSLLADAARLMANQAMKQLLGLALNFVVSAASNYAAGSNNANYSNEGNNYSQPIEMAKGGLMTSYGELPLRKYAKGGVEHGPAVSIHGEGSLPEANVPLQDGRTIPVTLSGGSGGGNTQVSIAVHVDSNGSSKVESDASGKKAQQLGAMIESSIVQVIQREKRPGGLLYA